MKRLGLIGGLSWESTRLYYDAINRAVSKALGGAHSADIVVVSLDFAPFATMQAEGRWDEIGQALADAAQGLDRYGVDAIAIASNTMHKCVDMVSNAVSVPLVHIVDALAKALLRDGRARPLLLGTRFTMTEAFVTDRLVAAGIDPMIPASADCTRIDAIIYDELVKGIVRDDSRNAYLAIIEGARASGADSVILGCTEIGMLVNAANSALPVYDTMQIHADAIVAFMLGQDGA